MKTNALWMMVAVAVLNAGCSFASRHEFGFTPSPDSQYIASLISETIDLKIPAEGIRVRESIALRVRQVDGTDAARISLFSSMQQATPHSQLAWSPNGSRLAVLIGSNLWSVDTTSFHVTELSQETAVAIRWVTETSIVVVQRSDLQRDRLRIRTYDAPTGKIIQELTIEGSVRPLISTSRFENPISFDGKLLLHTTDRGQHEPALVLASVDSGETLIELPVRAARSWYWSDRDSRCIIRTRDRCYLFDRETGITTDLSEYFVQTGERILGGSIEPSAFGKRTWSSSGTWFVLGAHISVPWRGTEAWKAQDWICSSQSRNVLRLQESLGDFDVMRVAPTTDRIAYAADDVLYVTTVEVDADGRIATSTPTVVTQDLGTRSWMWAPCGERLFVVDEDSIEVVSLENTSPDE